MTTSNSLSDPALSSRDIAEGALAWWAEAGVDVAFADEPTEWLAEAAGEDETAAPPPPKIDIPRKTTARERALTSVDAVQIGGNAANWPQDLAAFREFWMLEPTLDGGGTQGRIVSRGAAGAKLAVLVGQPEEKDTDLLLSGRTGAFLDAILSAMGLAEGEVYRASALPRPVLAPDWSDMAQRGLRALTHRHMALAEPKRLIVFGSGLQPLLAEGDTPASIRFGERDTPVMMAPRLDRLMRAPGYRKKFWADWLDWSADG